MKLSEKDRINAVVRHPEYREDLMEENRLKMERRYDEANRVLTWISVKWKVKFPPPINQERSHLCFEYHAPPSVEVVTSISPDYPPLAVKQPSPWGLEGFKSYEEAIIWQQEHTTLDGKYLYLRVDITDSQKNLMRGFADLLEIYKSCLPEQKERKADLLYPPWIVYDMYHHIRWEHDKTKIAKALSGIDDTNSDHFKAAWKRVDRAYRKACRMIEEVGKQVADFPKTLTMGDDKIMELESAIIIDDIIDD